MSTFNLLTFYLTVEIGCPQDLLCRWFSSEWYHAYFIVSLTSLHSGSLAR